MKRLWNSFKIAFSMYSKLPMPHSEWSGENMRYTMGFLPLVGLAVGAAVYGAALLFAHLGIPDSHFFRAAVLTALPVLLTGGIHLDGFLDTSDALSSWQERERRLEILKDSHAGAFAIICGGTYFLLYAGAVSMIESRTFGFLILFFVLIRAASGLSIVSFPKAKDTGLAAMFSDHAHKRVIEVWMWFYLFICAAASFLWNRPLAAVCNAAVLAMFAYYKRMSQKNFGGINGDLAGWFLQMAELFVLLGTAALTAARGGSLWN